MTPHAQNKRKGAQGAQDGHETIEEDDKGAGHD